MALQPNQLDDFVANTLPFFHKNRWKDISLDQQDYIFASRTFEGGKIPVRGGQYLQEQIQVRNTGTFEYTGLYGVADAKVVDLIKTSTMDWSMNRVHWIYDIYENDFQSGPETILRTIQVRQHSMYNDYFEGMEAALWGAPTSSTQDPKVPAGIPFWVQKSASAKPFGFNGGNPSGFSAGAGGLNSDTYPNWKNGTFRYDALSQDDALSKWAEACHKCYFKAPRSYAELDGGKPRYSFYTTYPVLEQLHKLMTASNDNLGNDVGKYRDTALFKGVPVVWVPALTNSSSSVVDTSNPIYGIDWSVIKYYYKQGADRKLHAPITPESQPSVRKVYMDSWGNFICTNRRALFVGTST